MTVLSKNLLIMQPIQFNIFCHQLINFKFIQNNETDS